MKKTILFGMAITALTLTSCGGGSSLEQDATKMADLACETFGLFGKSDEASTKRMAEIEKEGEDLGKELEAKYKEGTEEAKQFEEIMEKKLTECPAYKEFQKSLEDLGSEWEDESLNLEEEMIEELSDEMSEEVTEESAE